MNRSKETFDTWNNIASIYQQKFMDLDLYDETYDYICSVVNKRNARLLDIGCGPGNITRYLLTKRPDFKILGIDTSPKMIALAMENNPTARFEVMDCRAIGELSTGFDGIIGGFCLPYLSGSEAGSLIQDARDLLNMHGLLYLSFVEGDPENSGFKTGSGGRVYFYYHELANLKAQLVCAGFDEQRLYHLRFKTSENEYDPHTVLIAKKAEL